jgi:hypothetical protein
VVRGEWRLGKDGRVLVGKDGRPLRQPSPWGARWRNRLLIEAGLVLSRDQRRGRSIRIRHATGIAARECPPNPDYAARMATTFKAEFRLLPTADGGRETPLRPGYRSTARLGDDDEFWGIEITFDKPQMLAPGEATTVSLMAWANPNAPAAGTVIKVYEGARLVGTGTVVE